VALFLLDPSVCVDILRQRVPTTALPPPRECCLSAIVTAELRTGLAKGPVNAARTSKLTDFIEAFPVLAFDDAAARHGASIRADLETRGVTIGPLDLLIAAHARSAGATLVTGNVGEFRRVRRLKVLAWRQGRRP
jgi:tRNA(fMet)-specific endonuclease VapC